jgi:hypothetical protein
VLGSMLQQQQSPLLLIYLGLAPCKQSYFQKVHEKLLRNASNTAECSVSPSFVLAQGTRQLATCKACSICWAQLAMSSQDWASTSFDTAHGYASKFRRDYAGKPPLGTAADKPFGATVTYRM